jgi:hypothetical protein
VATDDFRIVNPLRNALGLNYEVQSNSESDVRGGYDQTQFNSLHVSLRRERTLRFFSELEIMFLADHFIGASTTNVFNLVRYMRANKEITDVVGS